MLEKLKAAEERYSEINERLMDAGVVNDQEQYKKLMKEYKTLTPLVEKYREYKKAESDFAEAKEMLEEGGLDKDLKEMAQLQLEENKELISRITEELKIMLLPKDPDDDRNVIIEIRGGAGGDESAGGGGGGAGANWGASGTNPHIIPTSVAIRNMKYGIPENLGQGGAGSSTANTEGEEGNSGWVYLLRYEDINSITDCQFIIGPAKSLDNYGNITDEVTETINYNNLTGSESFGDIIEFSDVDSIMDLGILGQDITQQQDMGHI